MLFVLWPFMAVVGAAFIFTWLLRRYALARSMLDLPNARSSHSRATPRGGGVAIVLSFLSAVLIFAAYDESMESAFVWAVTGGGFAVALLGFLDDHGHIAARWRLLGHFLAAFWVLYWLGGLPPSQILGVTVHFGWSGYVLAALYLVWLLNLYNFMDGIDGLASVEAISAALGAASLYLILGLSEYAIAPVLLACAVAGFLVWNFPPAKIFMGDAGSGFLGVTLGVLSLQAAWISSNLLASWLILLGVFIVDATVTLLRRLLRGVKVYEAHRNHAYQFASRRYGSHLIVTIFILVINMFWLYPLAWLVAIKRLESLSGIVIAYVPLLVLALTFRAGKIEE
ncbi:MraY family glycosyltransferase [Eoetvoesiella caeni]